MTNTFAKWVDEPHRNTFWPTLRRWMSEPAANAAAASRDEGQDQGQQDFVDTMPASYITASRRPARHGEGR